jgi:hypothetical protein
MFVALRSTFNLVLSAILLLLSFETIKVTFGEWSVLGDSLPAGLSQRRPTKTPKSTHLRIKEQQQQQFSSVQNLRLVFMGDSVTRYQYLSLAYFLRHGRWFDPDITVNNLMNSHSFHHPLHPDDDWNEFFLQSNRMLYPLEVCDCLRSRHEEILVERRYFYDSVHNNLLVYINMNGNKTPADRGYYGRLNPRDIFGSNFPKMVGLPFGMDMNTTDISHTVRSIQWEYSTWADVIRHHIGHLNLNCDGTATPKRRTTNTPSNARVILNAGIHPHDFDNPETVRDVDQALNEVSLPGIWKTTTYSKEYTLEYQTWLPEHDLVSADSEDDFVPTDDVVVANVGPAVRSADQVMCRTLSGCMNLSWTARLRTQFFLDNLHFSEPVYRIFNEELLETIQQLPRDYVKFERSAVTIDNNQFSLDVP